MQPNKMSSPGPTANQAGNVGPTREERQPWRFRGPVSILRRGREIDGAQDSNIVDMNRKVMRQSTGARAFLDLGNELPSRGITLSEAFDLTDRAYGGLVEGRSTTINNIGAYPVFDLENSQLWALRDMDIFLAGGGACPAAIHMERVGGGSAGIHNLSNIGISGYPTLAGVEIDASEANRWEHCAISTFALSGAPKPCVYIHTTSGGLLTQWFVNCHFLVGTGGSSTSKCVHATYGASSLGDVHFQNCTFTCTAGSALAGIHIEDLTGATTFQWSFEQCRFECDNALYGIFFDCPSSGVTIRQCTIIAKNHAIYANQDAQGWCIDECALYNATENAPIRVNNLNASRVNAWWYVLPSAGGVRMQIDGAATNSLLIADNPAVITGTVAASSSIQTRYGA